MVSVLYCHSIVMTGSAFCTKNDMYKNRKKKLTIKLHFYTDFGSKKKTYGKKNLLPLCGVQLSWKVATYSTARCGTTLFHRVHRTIYTRDVYFILPTSPLLTSLFGNHVVSWSFSQPIRVSSFLAQRQSLQKT